MDSLTERTVSEHLELLDYRRRVAGFYARVRGSDPTEETWRRWRAERDDLFGSHPQSPIEDRGAFDSLPFFDYHPGYRVEARYRDTTLGLTSVSHSGSGSTAFQKVGTLEFVIEGRELALTVLWLDAYGGGLFVPFRDLTNGTTTYGGGRYILDTVKGADLGHEGNRVVLDFNYAYHPSCVHSPRWSCPLAPPENRLDFAITAGERLGADKG